jgi:hypothetical protein
MNFQVAQQEFAETLKNIHKKTPKAYFWRLTGDEPNSLSKLLGTTEEEMKILLRLCKVYGLNDNISKNN